MSSTLRRLRLAAYIALRVVRSRRSPTLSLVTVISIVGIAFGVLALTVMLGVTGGFQQAFQDRILGLYPHLVVHKRGTDFREYPRMLEEIEAAPGVVGASPVTYDDMMIAAGMPRSGAIVKGIHLPSVGRVVRVHELLQGDAKLESLGEDPALSWDRAARRASIDDVVAQTWTTVIQQGGELTWVRDDRTPPDPAHARLQILDLRGGEATSLKLTPVAAKDEPVPSDVKALPLPDTRPGQLTAAAEVPSGDWRLDAGDTLLTVDDDTLVTLVLLPTGAGGAARARVLVEPARIPVRERTAMVRIVNADVGGEPIAWHGPHGALSEEPVAAGAGTRYASVPARLPGVLLGTSLAKRLAIEVGGEVTLVTPLRGVDNKMMGPYGMAPSSSRHVVTGLFESGFYEYDVRLALVNIEAAQRFLNRGPVIRWIEVAAEDVLTLERVKKRVAAVADPFDLATVTRSANLLDEKLRKLIAGEVTGVRLEPAYTFTGALDNALRVLSVMKYQEYDLGYSPRYRLIDWQEMNSNLFSALKLQKVILTLFFLIIIVVGSFVVVGAQIMVIHDKTPEIAILKAMGATDGMVRAVFSLQGLMVAVVGTALGVASGLGICALISLVDYELDAAIYLIDRLPVQVSAMEVTLIVLGTLLVTIVATQYSAGRAARKTPVEGLRAVD